MTRMREMEHSAVINMTDCQEEEIGSLQSRNKRPIVSDGNEESAAKLRS